MSNPLARLRAVAESLPDGASATLGKEFLLAATEASCCTAGDLTVRDVATHCGRAPSTVRSWLEQGVLRGYRFRSREWRITQAALAEFEEAERTGSQLARRSNGNGSNDLGAWRSVESSQP